MIEWTNQRMNKWMDRWKKKIDTTCLELNLNLWTEPATDKKFTHRCEFAVNSARHWAHFDMNKKQSSLRSPMSCVLLVYAVYFSLWIFSNNFLQKKQLLCLRHGSLLMSCVKRDRICARSYVNRPMRRPGCSRLRKKICIYHAV